jgi:hypothetical protein
MGALGNRVLRAILGQIRRNKQGTKENYIIRNFKKGKPQRVLVGNLKEKDHSSDLSVDKRIILTS